MIDSELLELCKEVYRRAKWGQYGDEGLDYFNQELNVARKDIPPLYTSDYLLEKLPTPLIFDNNDCAIEVRRTKGDKYKWSANIRHSYGQYFKQVSDTPLKALLKLAIALDDAGVKL